MPHFSHAEGNQLGQSECGRVTADTSHLMPDAMCALTHRDANTDKLWCLNANSDFSPFCEFEERAAVPLFWHVSPCCSSAYQSAPVLYLLGRFLRYCTCKCGGKTARGCQHIAGRQQTAHERGEKTICSCFMLILEGLVSFDVKQNTANYLCLLHTHTHTHPLDRCSPSVYLWVWISECESDQ